MNQLIKDIISEQGYASSTRIVKIFLVLIFGFDWIWSRVVEHQLIFNPTLEILGFIATILGLSLVQKIIENKKAG